MKTFLKKSILFFVGIFLGVFFTIKFNLLDLIKAENPELEFQKNNKVYTSKEIASVQSLNKSFVEISRDLIPTVVTITSERIVDFSDEVAESGNYYHFNLPFGDYYESGLGSGIIISSNGYILTNNHVVEKADQVTVKLTDKREFNAQIIGTDPLTDIALLKIDGENLPVAPVGNSDSLQVGEFVLAIGTPLDLSSTVTAGIVSALGRKINVLQDSYAVETFIQTDAAINPGNSGGALVNLKGEVIGVNTAIATKTGYYQGYGFAVPINLATEVAKNLSKFGKMQRGYLGVMIEDVTDKIAKESEMEKPQGVRIAGLIAGKAADKAGLKVGDIVLSINGKNIFETNELQGLISTKKPNENISLRINRDGKELNLNVILEEIQKEPETAQTPKEMNIPDLGITVVELSAKQLSEEFGFEQTEKGVLVTDVEYFSRARKNGIKKGELITRVGVRKIKTIKELIFALEEQKEQEKIFFHLKNSENNIRVVEVENWQ
ncbi:Do family serine endopeptidase [bacterium]|nr:Do family serine endopeptidase [bacterium]